MPLRMNSRATVRFEWSDDDAETVVAIDPSEDQETIVRKLKRIVALVEGDAVPPPWNPATDMKLVRSTPVAISAPPELGEKQITNGWAMIDDPLPEAP